MRNFTATLLLGTLAISSWRTASKVEARATNSDLELTVAVANARTRTLSHNLVLTAELNLTAGFVAIVYQLRKLVRWLRFRRRD